MLAFISHMKFAVVNVTIEVFFSRILTVRYALFLCSLAIVRWALSMCVYRFSIAVSERYAFCVDCRSMWLFFGASKNERKI